MEERKNEAARPAEATSWALSAGRFTDIERTERIYVNRNLRMDKIEAIGFDMDHTLAIYEPHPFETLAFEQARRKLLEAGYPEEIERLRYDHEFVMRGLVVDCRNGNILKMDEHNYVVQAYHGTRKLPPEARRATYASRRIRLSGLTYTVIDTLFSLPEISLFAQMVDVMDRYERHPNYRTLYRDVRAAVDEAHADGSIKGVIELNPSHYLEVDGALAQTLDRIRNHGKKVFLLTNSEPAYTTLIMDALLTNCPPEPRHWSAYFDLIVVRARKPGFFGHHAALIPLAPSAFGVERDVWQTRGFQGGSVRALEREVKVSGDRVLYFGDHTYGDILKSKRICGWRTAMVIRDLADEVRKIDKIQPWLRNLSTMERQRDRLLGWKEFLTRCVEGTVSAEVSAKLVARMGLNGDIDQLQSQLERVGREVEVLNHEIERLERLCEITFNPYWGSLFKAGRASSHFGRQVNEFACIYTSRVSNLLSYSLDKYFEAPEEFMPHEL